VTGLRPDILQPMLRPGEDLFVEVRVLADQVRAVAKVKFRVTEPRRKQDLGGVVRMRSLRSELADVVPCGVGEAALGPFVHHGQAIHGEGRNVPHPHSDGGVRLPSVFRDDQSAECLQRVDALLAQPGCVQRGRALPEIGIGEEGLHPFSLPSLTRCAN